MKLNRAQLLALNLDSHIVVDAGSGTGKTSTIIDRVIEHYLSENQRAIRICLSLKDHSNYQAGCKYQGNQIHRILENGVGITWRSGITNFHK